MPDPIPVIVLGRLAVDINHQGLGIGKGLVKDAVLRTLQASEIAGIAAILVHAIDEEAKKFYVERCSFTPFCFRTAECFLISSVITRKNQ
jgi:predicted N-acetyltransferase YhbS